MRIIFILIFLANIVLSIISLAILPSRVAIHFGVGGMANGWVSSYVNTLLFTGTSTILFFWLYFAPRMVFMFPSRWINLPNKDYWLRPENKNRMVSQFSFTMWEFGTALFIFLFIIEVLAIQANLSHPVRLDERLFLFALIVFIIYSLYWCVKFFKAFRIPR